MSEIIYCGFKLSEHQSNHIKLLFKTNLQSSQFNYNFLNVPHNSPKDLTLVILGNESGIINRQN